MSVVVVGIVVTLTLHFGWEMLQAPPFMDFAGSTWEGTVRCFVAPVGDMLLASGAYRGHGAGYRSGGRGTASSPADLARSGTKSHS